MEIITQPSPSPAANIACIIMASGNASRFGSNKLLADFNGQPLLQNILTVTSMLPFLTRLAVTRSSEAAEICQKMHVPVLLHNEPGQNDTVHLALARLHKLHPAGYLFCVADQPLLKAATLQNLCTAFAGDAAYIYRPAYQGKPGNPILFPARYTSELMQLPQDKGGSYLTKKYPEQVKYLPVQDAYELYDVDTAEDLQHLEMLLTPAAAEHSER